MAHFLHFYLLSSSYFLPEFPFNCIYIDQSSDLMEYIMAVRAQMEEAKASRISLECMESMTIHPTTYLFHVSMLVSKYNCILKLP